MEIAILGPLTVTDGGAPIAVRGAKRRLLLTMLAVYAGRIAPVDRLVDALWGDGQTESSAPTLQTYVYQLRRVLGVAAVVTGPQGYSLGCRPDSVDVHQFEALVTEAAELADAARRRDVLARGLALWRGPAFGEFPDVAMLSGEAVRLEELRLRALEDRIDADLALGNHGPVVAELEREVLEHGLRERLWAQLMVALYRGGRQADALRAFERLQTQLREQLGIDPSPALVRLERQILVQDAALDAPDRRASIDLPPALPQTREAMAFLFTDIEGSTRRWETMPDEMDPALAEHDRILRGRIDEAGGRVVTTAGDSFVAAFMDTADALAAALAIQLALAEGEWSTVGGLAVRMGIHVGPVIEREGTYFGPTLNRAARLHTVAHGGQVLLSAAAAGAVVDRLPVDSSLIDLGLHRLRDLGQPERIHQLVHPKLLRSFPPLKADTAAATAKTAGPMVGRDGEVAHIEDRLHRVRAEGAGGVVMIVGEPGIGKTRVATAVAESARAAGVRVLWGRCVDGAWAPPYAPFAEALADLVRQEPDSGLAALGSRASVLAPLVAVSGAVDAPADTGLDPNEQRTRVFAAVAGLLSELSEQGSLLIVLDDLHWADQGTTALLRYVAREIANRPVLLVGTYRDSEVPARHPLHDVLGTLPRETDYDRVVLRGLSVDDVAALAHVVVPDELPRAMLTALATDTGGNAFFVQQVLQQLAADAAQGDVAPGTFSVPPTVLSVVDHRVAGLPGVAQRFLRAAAVFDGDFDFAVVAAVADLDEDAALDGLDAALDARLLDPTDKSEVYRFVHALVRQALTTGLSPSRLVRMHRRAAVALEPGLAEDLMRAGRIATHYAHSAELPGAERGVGPALLAAEQAQHTGGHDEAVAFVRLALQLLPAGDVRQAELTGRLGCALARGACEDEALTTIDEAVDLIEGAHGRERAAEYVVEAVEALTAGLAWLPASLPRRGLDLIGERRDDTWATLFAMSVDRMEGLDGYYAARLSEEFAHASRIVLASRRATIGIAVPAACRNRDEVLALDWWPSARMNFGGDLRGPLSDFAAEAAAAWRDGRLHWWAQVRSYMAVCHTALGNLAEAREILDGTIDVRLPPSPSQEAEERLLLAAFLLASAWDTDWDYVDRFATRFTAQIETAREIGTGERAPDADGAGGAIFAVGAAKILARGGGSGVVEQLAPVISAITEPGPLADIQIVHNFVEALWYANEAAYMDVAEAAVRQKLQPDVRAPMTEARLSMARLAALRGDVSAASQWFADARVVLDESGARTMRAITDFDEALMHSRLGTERDQVTMAERLAATRTEFAAIGMPGWRERAETLARS